MPRPKERYEQMRKLINAEKETKVVELTHKAYDIILNGPQDYQLVELSYNPTEGEAEMKIIEKYIFSLALARVKRDNKSVEEFINKQKKGHL